MIDNTGLSLAKVIEGTSGIRQGKGIQIQGKETVDDAYTAVYASFLTELKRNEE